MFVLSREIGESVIVEDVALTLVRIGEQYVEVSLVKMTGGKSTVLTLPRHQPVDICYDVQVVFVAAENSKARLGIEYPPEVSITRREFWESQSRFGRQIE